MFAVRKRPAQLVQQIVHTAVHNACIRFETQMLTLINLMQRALDAHAGDIEGVEAEFDEHRFAACFECFERHFEIFA